jgi:hypothetical protein
MEGNLKMLELNSSVSTGKILPKRKFETSAIRILFNYVMHEKSIKTFFIQRYYSHINVYILTILLLAVIYA